VKRELKYYINIIFSSLSQNSFSVNLLLFLGLTAFILIGIDLGSELSVQKDEITVVVGNLENVINLNVSFSGSSNPLPLSGLIPTLHFSFSDNIFLTLSQNRAPPSS